MDIDNMIMITTFHDLCLDVTVELFSYFNIHEIFYSFCLLVPCLPELLVNTHARLHVRSNNAYFIRWILPYIKLTQVVSLNVLTRPYNPSIFQFSGLRSLVLHDIDDPLSLLETTNNWPPCNLEHLSLYIRNQDIPNTSSHLGIRVLQHVLQLPRLKHFELHESTSSLRMVELSDQLNFPTKFHSSNIQSLIITVYCHWKTFQSILSYSPHLRHLQIRSSWNSSEQFSSHLYFPSIRILNLRLDGLQTDILIQLFQNCPFLRQLKLKCSIPLFKQSDKNLLKSDTWIQLMDTYIPRLQLLHIDMRFRLDNESEKTIQMINEDLRVLDFKLDLDLENGQQAWKVVGKFNRNNNNRYIQNMR